MNYEAKRPRPKKGKKKKKMDKVELAVYCVLGSVIFLLLYLGMYLAIRIADPTALVEPGDNYLFPSLD